MQNSSQIKPLSLWQVHGLMLLAAVLVSTSFTVAAAITGGLDPAVLTLVRFAVAVFLFAPFVGIKYSLRPPALKHLAGHGLISATIVGFFWCMFEALRSTSALHTSVIFTLVPGISGIYSAVLLGERLGRERLLALFFGMAGALWVIFGGDVNRLLGLEINSGDLLFLFGCFLMAFYTPLVKLFHHPEEPMAVMTFWVLATGVGWLLLPAGGRLATVAWAGVPSVVWAGILYLAVFTTIVTFFLTQLATLYLGPTRVMAYSYFYPAFVLVIDWASGHGLPPAVIMPGVIVVLLAILVLQSGAEGLRHRGPS